MSNKDRTTCVTKWKASMVFSFSIYLLFDNNNQDFDRPFLIYQFRCVRFYFFSFFFWLGRESHYSGTETVSYFEARNTMNFTREKTVRFQK